MMARRLGLLAVVGILIGGILIEAPVGMAWQHEPPCPPGARECTPPEPLDESSAPRADRTEQHPCDWVETCQFPCGEGSVCCQADWNCPADATLPRC
ncbi:hypothetical protein [Cystobacter fuscus]|uniref:hypothetical protein n=1 Tax=Cystobacter fuscus TaxID=43 RepID=UPI002B2B00C0|nr:hypothetical protein F0U63_01550 [Cystobacter fuscus]